MKFLKMKATPECAELYVYGDIVSSEWEKFSPEDRCPQEIVDFVKSLDGQPIEMHINSCGGDVFAGIAIYNTLKNYKGTVTAYVDGLAASIASIIALAADKVVMLLGAQYMIHKPWSMCIGNSDEMLHCAELLDGIQNQMLSIYSERAKTAPEVINGMIDAETWLSGEQAADLFGFEVEPLKMAACVKSDLLKNYKNVPQLDFEEEKTEPVIKPVKDKTQEIEKLKLKLELMTM